MSGKTLNRARRDVKKYVTRGGFEENITLATPNGITTINTTGLNSKHWINFDTDGNATNSKNAHITLSENDLISLAYPYRNADNEVFLYNHRVSVTDSSGIVKEYVIKEWFPDETLGLIACILADYDLN